MNWMLLIPIFWAGTQDPGLEYLAPEDSSGTSRAVVVRHSALAHTAQILPLDEQGTIVGRGDGERQIHRVMEGLALALREAGSDLDRAVRIHVYAARPEMVEAARNAFSRRWTGPAKPAATFVVGALAHPEALVAMDAVAAAPATPSVRRARAAGLAGAPGSSHVAILPAGPAVFVSGQAAAGELGAATRKTLQGLRETLAEFGMKDEHVVQLKAFLKPMSDVAIVEKEIAGFFGERNRPPVVLVEWTLDQPIEIELVAQGTPSEGGPEGLRFLTPSGVKPSAVYSRLARVDRGNLIFLSGVYGTGEPQGQVRGAFAALKETVEKAGSDFRHLVKATYYVSDGPTTDQLGKVRLEVYDPARPPAASKAGVRGIGVAGKTLTIDMIAVTGP